MCLSATKEILHQIFLSITYIHAYDYILAANPRCPKVLIQSEILKLEKHSLTHVLNHTTSRLHKTSNTHLIQGDACHYSDIYSPEDTKKHSQISDYYIYFGQQTMLNTVFV
jgi:hypothetical protein